MSDLDQEDLTPYDTIQEGLINETLNGKLIAYISDDQGQLQWRAATQGPKGQVVPNEHLPAACLAQIFIDLSVEMHWEIRQGQPGLLLSPVPESKKQFWLPLATLSTALESAPAQDS